MAALSSLVNPEQIQTSPSPRIGPDEGITERPPPRLAVEVEENEYRLDASIAEEEIRTFVGPNADYYLRKWQTVLEGGQGSSGFNGAAFGVSGLWLPYRKLYAVTFAFYGILLVDNLLELFLSPQLGEGLVLGAAWIVALVGWIVCGFFGNKWYLSKAMRVIRQVRALRLEKEAHLERLRKQGGTNLPASLGLFVLFVGLNVAVPVGLESLSFSDFCLGTKLTFNNGELYYKSSVSPQEAQKLGQYLVGAGFFDGKPKTVQLDRSGNKVEFRMVVLSGRDQDPHFNQTVKQFAVELSRNVFDGVAVDIHLCDQYLKTLRVFSSY
jgi:hypothetical protein